jgi:thioredoxin reductase (NADPH)
VGTKERKIGLPKEDELFGHGLSYCALCDGHFFKGQDVAVIGGGNAALKEAIHLAGIVKKLYVIHRRNEFRGSLNLVNELKEMDNVEIITPYIPVEILGDDKVTGLVFISCDDNRNDFTFSVGGLGVKVCTEFTHVDTSRSEFWTWLSFATRKFHLHDFCDFLHLTFLLL